MVYTWLYTMVYTFPPPRVVSVYAELRGPYEEYKNTQELTIINLKVVYRPVKR